MSDRNSALDRLEARLEAQTARIDELYRLVEAAFAKQGAPAPRRRPLRRHSRMAATPHR